MADNPPYVVSPGTLETALKKIKAAATPEKFTQDFLQNTLQMKGGTAQTVVPFLKKVGFLGSDGTPTPLYHQFRNPANSAHAVAQALRTGYKALFDVNEGAHALSDNELKGLIVQVTGLTEDSRVVQAVMGCFKKLKQYADFKPKKVEPEDKGKKDGSDLPAVRKSEAPEGMVGLNLSYTINLNLPSTTNIEVFHAIFKSLKENLLKQ